MTPTSSDQAALVALSARADRAYRVVQTVEGTPALHDLDAIVDAARLTLATDGVHLALLTDRQVTASTGTTELLPRGTQTPFDDTICANALRSNEPIVIDNAAADSRVSSIPAVVSGMVGAYLGMPVRLDRSIVGVLCVFGDTPRHWTSDDREHLQSYAHQVEQELARLEAPATGQASESGV